MHVATGKINLGVFWAEAPSNDFAPTAYMGPVFSYYEKITRNFERLTDSEWKESVMHGQVPERPDWVNVYLCDRQGEKRAQGRELPGVVFTSLQEYQESLPENSRRFQNYPNPFNPSTTIYFELPTAGKTKLVIYDILGRHVEVLLDKMLTAGSHSINWYAQHVPSGIYLCRLITKNDVRTAKLLLTR